MDYLASLERLGDFLGRSVEMKAYTATAMTVRIHSAEASAAERPAAIRTWPLSVDPAASVSSGLTLAGDDMAAFVVAAEGATVADVWMAPSGYYQVSAHPKYPDQ